MHTRKAERFDHYHILAELAVVVGVEGAMGD
jgi:hypothetical protein